MHVRASIASVLGIGKDTEQLGRSATDCAPTSDAASKVCSRKKHFIFVEEGMTMFGMVSQVGQ